MSAEDRRAALGAALKHATADTTPDEVIVDAEFYLRWLAAEPASANGFVVDGRIMEAAIRGASSGIGFSLPLQVDLPVGRDTLARRIADSVVANLAFDRLIPFDEAATYPDRVAEEATP